MIKHIVMWKIEGTKDQTKEQVIQAMKEQFEALNGQIEGMHSLEVGCNYNTSEAAYDAVLTSVHTDKEALEAYQQHEKHQHVANTYVRPFATARAVVDFEL